MPLPGWLSFDPSSRTFSGTPGIDDVGTITVKVTATDTGDTSATGEFNITVIPVNHAPTLANPIPDQDATEDEEFNFPFAADTFHDVDAGDTLTYTASKPDGLPLPGWLSFDPSTRTFSGTPDNGDVGTIAIKVTATDTGDAFAIGAFDITVKPSSLTGWARRLGTAANDVGRGVAVDASGNTYVTGVLESNDDNAYDGVQADAFVAKYSPSGGLEWNVTVGGPGIEARGRAIAVDEAGNVYVTGFVQGSDVDFGNGRVVSTNYSSEDVLIWKLDTDGVTQWVHAIGDNTGNREAGIGIAVDDTGGAYVTGRFHGVVDFDPATGGSAVLNSNGSTDGFVAKYLSDGSFDWVHHIAGSNVEQGDAIALAPDGSVRVSGRFYDATNFDPGGTDVTIMSRDNADTFLLALTGSGGFGWVRRVGGDAEVLGTGVAADAAGNVYLAGFFRDEIDFDDDDVADATASGLADAYVAKFDASGAFQWGRYIGPGNVTLALGLTVDADGDSYTVGTFTDYVDFDPGNAVFRRYAWMDDIFVLQLDADGDFVRVHTFGSGSNDRGRGIALGPAGDVNITGYFSDSVVFETGTGVDVLTSTGGTDIFTAKLVAPSNLPPEIGDLIHNLYVDEDAPPVIPLADLYDVFHDPDHTDAALTYEVMFVSPTGIVDATLREGHLLDLTPLENQHGVVTVAVRATDPLGKWADDLFTVTVDAVNDAPENTVPGEQSTLENTPPHIAQKIRKAGLPPWALFWADGNRTLSDIARAVSAEQGKEIPVDQVIGFFEAHAELGYVKLVDAGDRMTGSGVVADLKALGVAPGMDDGA